MLDPSGRISELGEVMYGIRRSVATPRQYAYRNAKILRTENIIDLSNFSRRARWRTREKISREVFEKDFKN